MKSEDFPSFRDIKASIERINNKNLPIFTDGIDVEEFVKELSSCILKEFDFVINAIQPVKCNSPFLDFFRVRPYDTIQNINLIREHSYPPIDIVGMGRCNFPKYPVFYCSNNAGTALLEVVRNFKSATKEFCISKWELIPSEEEIFLESFLQIQLPKENYFNKLKTDFTERIKTPFEKEFKKEMNKDQQAGLIEYFKYFHSCFIQDRNYSLSAALAHRSLYAPHNCRTDILIYPSVQSLLKGVNLALNPNFVENNLKLSRLYVVNLKSFNPQNGEMGISISKYAEIKKNVVLWNTIYPENEDYMRLLTEDFGEILNSEFKKE